MKDEEIKLILRLLTYYGLLLKVQAAQTQVDRLLSFSVC
jgi:hypothetical protein